LADQTNISIDHRFPLCDIIVMTLVRRSQSAAREVIGRLGAHSGAGRIGNEASTASISQPEISEANIEYLRRMYASTRDWYTSAETKAQLLLAVDGAFITLLFGVLFGRPNDVRASADHFGIDTWVFMGLSITALAGAIVCAALCLWSLHGRSATEFASLRVDPSNPDSYRAEVLWYFGHVAQLKPDAVTERLLGADRSFEAKVLTYHVVDLACKVFRKHRWVNAGWILTALALIALTATGTSFFIHDQF